MKVTHEAVRVTVVTKNLLDGQCEVFGTISENRLCSAVTILPDPLQNVDCRPGVLGRCDADGDGDVLRGSVC